MWHAPALPASSQTKGYPLEIAAPPRLMVSGVILADQVLSMGWRARNAER